MKRAVVAIYVDPDFFPPTINAVLNLAEHMDEVVVVSRNNSVKDFLYPNNVRLKKTGNSVSVREMENQSMWHKIVFFIQFSLSMLREVRKEKSKLVLLYDPMALFAFFLIKSMLPKMKVWYHNHDMPDESKLRKYSLGYFAAIYEKKAMKNLDFLSLPSVERTRFYPTPGPTPVVFVIPNYPSIKVYGKMTKNHFEKGRINLIYQGFIGTGHGLEEFIKILSTRINGFSLHLTLKGSVTPAYKACLSQLAEEYQVSNRLRWEGIGPYNDLPVLTKSCDIGIGINTNKDAVSLTQGTSSNKIYEYAACGLPVILNADEQFTGYLGKCPWVVFTDSTEGSKGHAIKFIVENIDELSKSARESIEKSFNFENHFEPVLKKVLATLNHQT